MSVQRGWKIIAFSAPICQFLHSGFCIFMGQNIYVCLLEKMQLVMYSESFNISSSMLPFMFHIEALYYLQKKNF